MPTVVSTSTESTATAYSNQRKVDRCQNGVLWTASFRYASTSSAVCAMYYSTDNGATWTYNNYVTDGGGYNGSYTRNGSLFIDLDDYAHLVYKSNGNGYVYYQRGTPNAARTAWTWSAAALISSNTYFDYPDLVAFKTPGGTSWDVPIVASYAVGGTNAGNYALYERVRVASDGSVTTGLADGLGSNVGSQMWALGGSYGNAGQPYPSIDFNHTGDGKTVAGGTPHLYAAWSAGGAGAGKGIRFKKATYSAGSWTWGTEREIDASRYIANASHWLNCLFDGTRVIIPGMVYDATYIDLVLHERDAGDTATTARVLIDNIASADLLQHGSSSYDSAGNIYMLGNNVGTETAGTYDFVYRKWTRSGATLGAEVLIDSGVANVHASVKRGYSSSRLEWVYTDNSASPYNVTYEGVSLNVAPNAPTLTAPAAGATKVNPNATIRLDWTHSDPNNDVQNGYSVARRINGTTTWYYWTGSAWSTTQSWVTSSTEHLDVAASHWGHDQVWEWTAATRDPAGLTGPYATSRTFSTNKSPAAPTLGNPADGASLDNTSSITFSWTHSDPDGDGQNAYSLRRSTDGGATWTHWNGTSWVTSQTWIATSTQSVAVPGSTFVDGQAYTWSVATRDPLLATGPYAAARTLNIIDAAPAAPILVSPSSGSTVDDSAPVTFDWTFNDPGDTQSAYYLRRKRRP